MYNVLIVDDEPSAVSLLSNVIRKMCSDFEIQATAYNGIEALEVIHEIQPDLVLTDVRMPVMDGIELIRRISQEFPEIRVVILSGYSEFEYARSALIYGAEDYILKPVDISEFLKLMGKVKQKLDDQFYKKRNCIVSQIINEESTISAGKIKKYFLDEEYFAAVWRENALPRRFSIRNKEIFSENSPIIIYGRDNMEGMILCPVSVVTRKDFVTFFNHFSKRYESGAVGYKTTIIMKNSFPVEKAHMVLNGLSRMLNSVVTIGYNQILIIDNAAKEQYCVHTGTTLSTDAEKAIRTGSVENIIAVLEKYISVWSEEKCSQLWAESQVRHIFYQIEKRELLNLEQDTIEFLLEDAFYEAISMEDLLKNIVSIIEENRKSGKCEDSFSRQRLFAEIDGYLKEHLREQISVQDICLKFGVSKATLSKIFHENTDRSFHNYFIMLRVEKAKNVMKNSTDCFIKDVAQEVGYEDQFYFSRIFKSVTGISPSDYILHHFTTFS